MARTMVPAGPARGLRSGAILVLLTLLAAAGGKAAAPNAPATQTVPAPQNGTAGKPAPILSVAGADPASGVKLTLSTATASLRLPLELDSGEVKGLTVSVDDFIAPNAERIRPAVTLDGKPANQPIDVKQQDRPSLEIAATFPVPGDYASNIVLFYAGARAKSIPLTVTRQRNEVTAQIAGLDTVTTTKGLTADATIRFTVRETSGQKITLYPPVLEAFALKEGDKVRKQAHYEEIVVNGAKAAIVPRESFVVEPLSARPSVIEIRNIADAGEYVGTLRLAGSGGTPVTQEVTVLVKTSGWVAAWWIFLGVLASFLIRRYTKEQRPKLQALRRVRYAEDDLQRVEKDAGAPAAPAPAVFTGLRERLARIERALNDGTAKDGASSDLDKVEKKIQALPGWLTLGRKLDAVQPPDVVRTPRAEWIELASSYFLAPEAAGDITASLTKIEQSIAKAVSDRIDEFAKQVETYKSAHQAAQERIEKEVTPKLKTAKTAAEHGDWSGMTADFRAARLAYTRVLAGELESAIGAPQRPLGFDDDASWKDLRDKITAELALLQQETDPDHAVKIYERANQTFLAAVILKLKTLAEGLQKVGVTPEQKKQLDDAVAALTSATLAAQHDDWDTARAEYKKAATGVTSVLDARAAKAGDGAQSVGAGQTAASPGEAVPAGAAVGQVEALAAVQRRKRRTAEQISDLLDRYDLFLNLALLLIAVVVGLSLLWWTDPVWGGWKAYTTALLWGLGLHQVAGSSLDGLPAITEKLTTEKKE